MYLVDQEGKRAYNLDSQYYRGICAEKLQENSGCISIEHGENGTSVQIGYYKDCEDAKSALNFIMFAAEGGHKTFRVPQDWAGEKDGCDFCKESSQELGDGGAHDFKLKDNALFFRDSELGWEGIMIKYCPMCGRRIAL